MKIKTGNQHAQVTKSVSVWGDDAPVHDHAYSSTGKRYQVEFVKVTYHWDADRWDARHITVNGAVLKKDGTPGKEEFSGSPAYRYDQKPEWAWLVKVVEMLRPVSPAHLPELEAEVDA